MRSPIAFDTLEYMDQLKKSGMKPEEAEAITKATAKAFIQMIEVKEVATKSDLNGLEVALKSDLNKLEVALKTDINKLEVNLKSDIKELELVTKKDMSDLKVELMKFTHDTVWKAIGVVIAFQTIIVGISHFIK